MARQTSKRSNKKANKTRKNIGGGPGDRSRSRSRERTTILQDAKKYVKDITKDKRITEEEKKCRVVITLLDEDHNVFDIMKNQSHDDRDIVNKVERLQSLFNDSWIDNETEIKEIIKEILHNNNLFDIVLSFYEQELSDYDRAIHHDRETIYNRTEIKEIKKNIIYLKYILG